MFEKVSEYIDTHKEETMTLWENFVRCEGETTEVENIRKVAAFLCAELEKAGVKAEMREVGPLGPTVLGILGEERKGKPIVFSGHYDTVHSKGIFEDAVFVVKDDGNVYGSGVADMKGGLTAAITAVKALNYAGYNERPIKFVVSGDHETNHEDSYGGQIFVDVADGAVCVFNTEPGNPDGALVTGRKGRYRYRIRVYGKDAHAGRNYSEGRSAIKEMAYKIIELEKLTNLDSGTTVNIGVIKGGTVANAVPAYCEVELDTRFVTQKDCDEVVAGITRICNTTFVEGTRTEFKLASEMGVFETTDAVVEMNALINKVSAKYDLKEGRGGTVHVGGAADSSWTSKTCPHTICGIGVRGGGMHTKREYAVVDSVFERARLLAAVVLDVKDEWK